MKYIAVMLSNFYSELSYKLNFITGILNQAISLFLSLFVWLAIFKSTGEQEIAGFTRPDIILYIVLTNLSMMFFSTSEVVRMGSLVRTGKLTNMLLKPYSILGYNLSAYIGQRLIYVIPYMGVLLVFLFKNSNIYYNLAIILFGSINFLMFFLFMQCISNLGFYVVQMWPFSSLMNSIYFLFSGVYFPLNILPSGVYQWMKYNPFSMVGYHFTLAVQEKLDFSSVKELMLVSFLWLLLFYVLYRFTFKRGLKRYEGMGA
ncbi:MAG: ABC-2 family transporter protein [Tissierellia bacterium]|nr:ABC-2 family transporter protein [Tissierellia bacterium]